MKRHRRRRANKAHKAEKQAISRIDAAITLYALESTILKEFLRRLEAGGYPCGGHTSDAEYIVPAKKSTFKIQ